MQVAIHQVQIALGMPTIFRLADGGIQYAKDHSKMMMYLIAYYEQTHSKPTYLEPSITTSSQR